MAPDRSLRRKEGSAMRKYWLVPSDNDNRRVIAAIKYLES
jgi:hypothetical protein